MEQRRRPRILYITGDYPPRVGGQSRLSEYLVKGLKREFDVTVALLRYSEAFEAGLVTLNEGDQPTWLGRLAKKLKRSRHLLQALWIARTLGRKFDLVIAGDSEKSAVVGGYFSAIFLGRPMVSLCHGRDFCWKDFKGATGFIHKKLLLRSGLSIANSNATARNIRERNLARDVTVIHPPVSLERYYPISPDLNPLMAIFPKTPGKHQILTVSRLVPRKGVENVLHALSRLKSEGRRDFFYIVAGDGPERGGLQELAKDLGLARDVFFVGEVSDDQLVYYYNLCDVFVLAPYQIEEGYRVNYEGFGMVYLEANACGKPVIASRSGGIPDAVTDEVSGLLVDPQSARQIGEALVRLFDNPDFYRRLCRSSLDWVRNFEESVTTDQYLRAVRPMVREASAGSVGMK